MEEPRYINLPADKEVEDNMPTIELVECERVAYIKERRKEGERSGKVTSEYHMVAVLLNSKQQPP